MDPQNVSAPEGLAALGALKGDSLRKSGSHFSTPPARLQRLRLWLARVLTGRDFFNPDASREIDRLLIENERLRAQIAEGRA